MKTLPHTIVILALLCFSFHFWQKKRTAQRTYAHNMEVLNDSLHTYENKLGLVVAEKKAFQGEKKELEQLIELQGKQLQEALKRTKPTTATKIVTETKIDTVLVPFSSNFEFHKPTVDFDVFAPFSIKTEFYTIDGVVQDLGVLINSIRIPNEQSVVVGKKKIGFMKYEYRAEVTNSNPLITVTDLASFTFKEPKKRFGIGAFAGMAIDGTPTVGVGVTYSFLSF